MFYCVKGHILPHKRACITKKLVFILPAITFDNLHKLYVYDTPLLGIIISNRGVIMAECYLKWVFMITPSACLYERFKELHRTIYGDRARCSRQKYRLAGLESGLITCLIGNDSLAFQADKDNKRIQILIIQHHRLG